MIIHAKLIKVAIFEKNCDYLRKKNLKPSAENIDPKLVWGVCDNRNEVLKGGRCREVCDYLDFMKHFTQSRVERV